MKLSRELNTCASMSSIAMAATPVALLSFICPKSCALNTGDRAASTQRCAENVSPPATWKATSAPSLLVSSLPRCW
uniref:Uncharacterized protein n=1 Tax=Arundo donax TaxID=35708 RepID=A0A0A8XX96_ARUDO